jgi:acylphosphatase
MTHKRVEAVVSGRVQGVGFRYFATNSASRLGLAGIVQNNSTGQIFTIAEGEEEALKQYLADLRRGPIKSDVTSLQATWGDPTGQFKHFEAIG